MIPSEFLAKVRSIEIASRKLVQEGMAGQYLSAFRGSGMQFREFRAYVYGDDVRHIAWNASARMQEPVLKTFEEERERTLMLVVDTSASLRRGPWAGKKAERLAEIAATLAVSAIENNDKVGLLLFSDQIERVVLPEKGRRQLLRIIRDVLCHEPVGRRTTPDVALRHLDRVLKKQSIVFFLSDMEVLPGETVLRRVASKHEIIAVGVDHPAEWELPDVPGFLELQTAELQRPVTIDANSHELREYLRKHGQTRREIIQEVYRRGAIDLLWSRTDEDYVPLLRSFFRMRLARGRK